VIRAADRVALDLPVVDHVGSIVRAEVRTHVRAIRVEDRDAAALAAIDHHVLGEEPDRHRAVLDLLGVGDHEPAAREREFAETVFRRLCHYLPRPG
jgi:hypothetical protein